MQFFSNSPINQTKYQPTISARLPPLRDLWTQSAGRSFFLRGMRYYPNKPVSVLQAYERLHRLIEEFFVQQFKALVHEHGVQSDAARGRSDLTHKLRYEQEGCLEGFASRKRFLHFTPFHCNVWLHPDPDRSEFACCKLLSSVFACRILCSDQDSHTGGAGWPRLKTKDSWIVFIITQS